MHELQVYNTYELPTRSMHKHIRAWTRPRAEWISDPAPGVGAKHIHAWCVSGRGLHAEEPRTQVQRKAGRAAAVQHDKPKAPFSWRR